MIEVLAKSKLNSKKSLILKATKESKYFRKRILIV